MPITQENFTYSFDRLAANFSRTVSQKMQDLWFAQFEDCDLSTWQDAMWRLTRYGEKFPTWGMVWDVYTPMLPPDLQAKERAGCPSCTNGKVFYVDYVRRLRDDPKSGHIDYSRVANCGKCSNGAIGDMANVFRDSMIEDNWEYWTERAVDAKAKEQKKDEADLERRRAEWKQSRGGYQRASLKGEL